MQELTPERGQARESYRERIMSFIAGLATAKQVETPMPDIGLDDEIVS